MSNILEHTPSESIHLAKSPGFVAPATLVASLQLDAEAIRNLWSQPELQEKMDIVIDDGLHIYEATNLFFLNGSIDRVRPGGVYVVEDILTSSLPAWHSLLQSDFRTAFLTSGSRSLSFPTPTTPMTTTCSSFTAVNDPAASPGRFTRPASNQIEAWSRR